ncbi:MAG: PhzF family phenazine biosynthesis protein [Hormoscilla sp.]
MKNMTFYIVDVFAVGKYTGNQLAVFLDAGAISEAEMQQIALEMNYSETTFITSNEMRSGGGYDVRIFTPNKELPFAGHPTLGTAFIIQQALIKKPASRVNLNLKVGQIPVTWEGEFLWMRQNQPTFHRELPPEAIAPVINLGVEDIDTRFPIQEVDTGIPFIIVPLRTHKALKACRTDRAKYFELVEKTAAKEMLVFCPETYSPENNLSVRVFAEYLGIPEDPATGSANGCLAGYLVKHEYFGEDSINVRVEQGYEINRPSLLLLKAQKKQSEIEVNVGGKVVMVAKGEWV